MNVFNSIYNYRELLKTNVKKEIRGRYKNSFLGILWSFLNPLLQLLVYSVIFGALLAGDEKEIKNNNLNVKIRTTISSNDPVELRRIIIENQGNEEEIIEVTSYFEPVLSQKEQDYAHPVFNNLFLTTKYDEKTNSLIITRKVREKNQAKISVATTLSTNSETIGDFEYELETEKFIGRGNLNIPNMILNSIPLSKKTGLVTEPVNEALVS